MRSFLNQEKNIITFHISPHRITGCLFTKNKQSNQFILKTYFSEVVNHLSLEQLVIYNPTWMDRIIKTWIGKQIKNIPIAIALQGPLHDRFIKTATNHPEKDEIQINSCWNNKWSYDSFLSAESGFITYVAEIPHALIFQYQLLCKRNNTTLQMLTTEKQSLLHLYRIIKGSAYRPIELSIRLEKANYQLQSLIPPEAIYRVIQGVSAAIAPEILYPILVSSGLLYMKE